MRWIIVLLVISSLVTIINVAIELIKKDSKKDFKRIKNRIIRTCISIVIIIWYFVPYNLDFNLDKKEYVYLRFEIPDFDCRSIELTYKEKERLFQTLENLNVQREFFNGYRHATFYPYNAVNILFFSTDEKITSIYLSLDERGFRSIYNEFAFLEYDNKYLKIVNSNTLRAFVKQLIQEEIGQELNYKYYY
jgi:uncharacterized protein (UPF0297 family)